MTAEHWKQQAAERALELVEDGMTLGLGTGSTAARFVDLVGRRVKEGLKVRCVPTSEATSGTGRAARHSAHFARSAALSWTSQSTARMRSTTSLRLIKGGGGALLFEKIVATASGRMVVIADASKRVATLGKYPLPVEVVRFGLARDAQHGRSAGRGRRL